MILVIARLRIRPEGLDDLRRAVQEVRPASLAEDGAISYQVHTDLTDRGEIVFVEEWQDRAALDRHFTEPHFKAFDEKLQKVLVGTPEVVVHHVERSDRL